MQGDVIELNRGLEKNNTGYSLTQLMIGSEGTLAVITEAGLKLTRLPKNLSVFLFSVQDLEHLVALCESAQFGPFEINAMEFFSQRCLRTVEEKLKLKCRLQNAQPFYVLLEVEMPTASTEDLDAWLSDLLEKAVITDGYRGESSADRHAMWALREGITESISLTGRVRKHDIAVPLNQMVPFLTEGQKAFDRMKMGADLYLFGHFADGSPHFNLVKHPKTEDQDFDHACDRFDGELFSLLKKYGGSVSAEHGIGNLKKTWLPYSRTPRELEIYRSIKKAFDPKGLLNPGKIIDL
jgi:FAD/FMN-containing dehydrogenase